MKNRLLSLLLTAVLLFTAVVPVYAAEDTEPPADEWGGLAPPRSPEEETPEETPEDPKEEPSEENQETPEEDEIPGLEAGTVVAGTTLTQNRHIAYALGDGKAMPSFNPWRRVTRAEAAQMFYRLLPEETPVSPASYTDLPINAWYSNASSIMGGLGVMRPGEETFQPGEEITRGEFIHSLACFFPLRDDAEQFPDVPADSPDAPFIRSARAYGWTQGGKDGLFCPENLLTRAEAVVMINRALGRQADSEYIGTFHPAFYIDVSPETWFYYDVMEASVYHDHTGGETAERWTSHAVRQTVPTEGFHLVNGWLFFYDSTRGDVVRNGISGGHTFDINGHFTTGNAELDGKLRNIVLSKTTPDMTQEQKLRALYVYTRDSFTYLRRPAYPFGATDFMEEDALRILNTGYGNCYCYAALYWYLSRWLGYDARIFNGTLGKNCAPHSWVEITMDGTPYIFDTELEMAYRRKNRFDINLYKFQDLQNRWQYVRP